MTERGKKFATLPCETRMCCLCAADGGWSEWSAWDECSSTCGQGQRSRSRSRSHECPVSLHYLVKHECVVFVQLMGAGRSGQHGTSAAARAVNVKGQGQGQGHMSVLCRYTTLWNTNVLSVRSWWGLVGVVSMGRVQQYVRSRSKVKVKVKVTWVSCVATLPCETRMCCLCAVDGGWSEWSAWDECSSTCGQGQRSRSRECIAPTPAYGGRMCDGDSLQVEQCNQRPCPGQSRM